MPKYTIIRGSFHKRKDNTVYFQFWTREIVDQDILDSICDRPITIVIGEKK